MNLMMKAIEWTTKVSDKPGESIDSDFEPDDDASLRDWAQNMNAR